MHEWWVLRDESGRQRHVKKVSEKLVEREKVGLVKDALVAITAGPHQGLDGRILSLGGLESVSTMPSPAAEIDVG